MSTFCRVRREHAKDISELAMARGLEHSMLAFPGKRYSDWITFQLTNERSRQAFENLCRENCVTVDGYQVVNRMMDSVIAGTAANKVIDEALTGGMIRAMSAGAKYYCDDCGLPIPKYAGRYPKVCPECGGELTPPRERPSEEGE